MKSPTIRESAAEYGRGTVGGLLFALPLLYTMEVWQTGFIAAPEKLLAGLGGTFALLLLYNRYAGLREGAELREIAIDSVEELALGLGLAALVLWLTGRLSEGDELAASIGKIGVCGMMSAIGVSVGTAQLGEDNPEEEREVTFWGQLGIGLCGAVIVAGNVAPTEEVQRVAYEATPAMLLGIVALSLVLTAIVAVASDFRGGKTWGVDIQVPDAVFAAVVTVALGTVVSYALLVFFGATGGNAPSIVVAESVVLGLPAALGASAGRQLLQT